MSLAIKGIITFPTLKDESKQTSVELRVQKGNTLKHKEMITIASQF